MVCWYGGGASKDFDYNSVIDIKTLYAAEGYITYLSVNDEQLFISYMQSKIPNDAFISFFRSEKDNDNGGVGIVQNDIYKPYKSKLGEDLSERLNGITEN